MRSRTFFESHPVFRLDEAAEALGLADRPRLAVKRLVYHAGEGTLKQVERGLWAVVPPSVEPEGFEPDRFAVAAALRPDAVFCYHSALELLGAAHSEARLCTVFTRHRRRPLALRGARIEFLRPPVALLRAERERLGVRETRRLGRRLEFTGPERTLVEGFRRLDRVGGLEELVTSAEGFASLDFALLREVLEAYDEKAVWAAVGWFLERHRRAFLVSDRLLAELERRRPKAPQYLSRSERGGTMVKRWNLVLPPSPLFAREPDEA
ncbi:MAG TPA: type IV toxin-antitoxin system AbiEi family antitoxin [Thermoanaerobaculia bacterium]|nr:type IV toxin-antitoxin system AbiEi family antitoxin [Thermoanaerobaculia bacterium]